MLESFLHQTALLIYGRIQKTVLSVPHPWMAVILVHSSHLSETEHSSILVLLYVTSVTGA